MKKLAAIFALLSLTLSVAQSLRLKPALGPIPAILFTPFKLLAGALAPVAILLGATGALLGLLTRSPLALLAGGVGAALAARFVRRVTAPHDGFDPEGQAARPPSRRWAGIRLPEPRPRRTRDLPFWTLNGGERGECKLLCDLWQPPQGIAPSGLGMIFLHGGGWHQYDKDSLTRPFFRHLAAQGHVVVDVAYRLWDEADLAGMVGDGKRAIAWLKANAGQYGVDPKHIVVSGGSAGGHLALMVAYTPGHPALTPDDLGDADTTVRAVVAFYPALDLRAYLAYNDYPTRVFGPLELTSPHLVVPAIAGGTPDRVPERYDLFTPASHAGPTSPPTLLLHSGHDHVVPVAPVRGLHHKLQEAGAASIYVEFPGTEHVFDLVLPRISPAAQAAWHDVDQFLSLLL